MISDFFYLHTNKTIIFKKNATLPDESEMAPSGFVVHVWPFSSEWTRVEWVQMLLEARALEADPAEIERIEKHGAVTYDDYMQYARAAMTSVTVNTGSEGMEVVLTGKGEDDGPEIEARGGDVVDALVAFLKT